MSDIDILEEVKHKQGIYLIYNCETSKGYIGKTICKGGFISRIKKHFSELSRNNHRNTHLQNSFNKYGFNVFKVFILQIVDEVDFEQIGDVEYFWLQYSMLFPNKYYNLDKSNQGNHIRSQETLNIISEKATGRKHSEITKEKIAEGHKGKKKCTNTTGYPGVIFNKKLNKYGWEIRRGDKTWLGKLYENVEDSYLEYLACVKLSDIELDDWVRINKRNKTNTTSKYVGVYFNKRDNKWYSQVYENNKLKHLGYFHTEEEAHKARLNKLGI